MRSHFNTRNTFNFYGKALTPLRRTTEIIIEKYNVWELTIYLVKTKYHIDLLYVFLLFELATL